MAVMNKAWLVVIVALGAYFLLRSYYEPSVQVLDKLEIAGIKYAGGICTVDIINYYNKTTDVRLISKTVCACYTQGSLCSIYGSGRDNYADVSIQPLTKISTSLACDFADYRKNYVLAVKMPSPFAVVYFWSNPDMRYGNLDCSKVDWVWTCRDDNIAVMPDCPEDYMEVKV